MESLLKMIWQPVEDGTERIEEWWKRNSNVIESISRVYTGEEVIIWATSYFRYGMYLHDDGYSKQSLEYIDKALDVLESNKGMLYENQYKNSLETIMGNKCWVLYKLERYWEAYKLMERLHSLKPEKDDYRLRMKDLFSAAVSKFVNPGYIVLICIWGFLLLDQYVFHAHFIPSFLWTLAWAVWIILLIIQFVLPVLLFKIKK